jgi:ATP-binding cassette subfamily B protein
MRKPLIPPHIRKIFSFMHKYRIAFIIGILLYSGQIFFGALINSIFISRITEAVVSADSNGIIAAVLLFVGAMVIYMPILGAGVILYVTNEAKAIRQLKRALFRRFVKSGLDSASHSGEGIASLNTEADTAADLYGNALSPFLSCVISIVFSAAVVFGIDYRLGLVSLVIGLLAFLIQARFAKPLGKIGEEQLTANSGAVKAMSDIFSGALAIRAFNAQERALLSFDKENGKLRALSFKKAFLSGWQSMFTTVQGWLTITGVFAVGGYLVTTGRLSFPALMMVPSMCQAIAYGMSGIGSSWAALQAPNAAAKRVYDLLAEAEDGSHQDEAAGLHPNDASLSIKNLRFSYASQNEPALYDINLTIAPNEMVAVVGESGSGKSTLLKVLGGFYGREGIDMRLGGEAFRLSSVYGWRKQFAYVDQSCKLFDMSIGENIALGTGRTDVTEAEIRQAAADAQADGFISELADGYGASCGEKGASLSGGQKQRIAIARALVRKAPVIIFDEATSALDAETERGIMRTIEGLRGRHTILITTHNLNNITGADKIIVMDKGRIVETGRHQELLTAGGLYKKMFMKKE